MDDGITAQVEYTYVAQEPDELNLTVGDLVKKCLQKEDGSVFRLVSLINSKYQAGWRARLMASVACSPIISCVR